MLVVTYLPRVAPIWWLSSKTLPPVVIKWLGYVPVAVLASMLCPALVMPAQKVDLSVHNVFLLASGPTILVAWKTRSFFGAVLTGMVVVACVRYCG
jgi:branched-subunit amino acid transport protein